MSALGRPLSGSSSATTLADQAGPPTNLQSTDQLLNDRTPACWRSSDIKSILRRKDQRNISRLCKFRPFNDEFIATEISPSILRPSSPTTYDVDWEPIRVLSLRAERVAEGWTGRVGHGFARFPSRTGYARHWAYYLIPSLFLRPVIFG
jgi:hypothetical protein